MFAFNGFLRRFRGGVPGAPMPAGLPADRRAELELELDAVFAGLAEPQRTADALVAQAKIEADQLRSRAGEAAAQLVDQARANAASEQSVAAAIRIARADVERRSLRAAADAETARIDRVARERVGAVVADLVLRVLEPPR